MTESVLSRLSAVGRVPEDLRHAAAQQRRFDLENTERSVGYIMLDCSGTTMDRYVDAPAIVFVEVFKKYGLEITMPEARAPMGLRKDLHIKAITEIPSVRTRFLAKFGREPGQGDVDAMFADFVPTQLALLRNGSYHTLLPGVGELVKDGRGRASGSASRPASRATCSICCSPVRRPRASCPTRIAPVTRSRCHGRPRTW